MSARSCGIASVLGMTGQWAANMLARVLTLCGYVLLGVACRNGIGRQSSQLLSLERCLPHTLWLLQVVVDPATASWTRRAVKNVTGELQGAAFLVREDTRGVANPGCGGVADGVAVTSNYQAM